MLRGCKGKKVGGNPIEVSHVDSLVAFISELGFKTVRNTDMVSGGKKNGRGGGRECGTLPAKSLGYSVYFSPLPYICRIQCPALLTSNPLANTRRL